jgi:hypothetical protein
MKKLFTLAAAVLTSFSLWAAYPTNTTTYALEDLTITEETLTYEKTGLSGDAQKLNKVLYIDVEVPCASANGNLYLRGTSSNTGRFATIWGSNGTERDEARKVAMKNGNSDAIAFTEADILEDGGKYYIRFSSADNSGSYFDYKISGFSYVLNEACVTKEVDHVDVALGGVAVNGEALSDNQMATLNSALSLDLANEYVEAPTVTFTVQTDTYYVGEETPSTKSEGIDVVAELAAGKWQAQYTVGEKTYTITAAKPATATVTYMDGETVLGTEIVKVGESATKHGEYEVKPLAEFQGWYTDAELTSEADLSATVDADMVLYGKFTKAYAQSLNIEQLVLDEGTKADIASILTNRGFAYAHINALDTLNDLENKANRNYAFLGLKLKTAGAYIQFNLQAGKTLAVKFGNLTKPVAVTINGEAQADHTEGAFLLDAADADRFIELKTTDGATVVLQQIMIGEPIADVTLPDPSAYLITIAESANGTVTANWDNKKYRTPVGATVTLTFTPAEGYIVMHCYVNGEEIHQSAPAAPITFQMPAEDVTVTTEFSVPTGIENVEEGVKAVKVVENGQMFILKGGVKYNAQGAIVK